MATTELTAVEKKKKMAATRVTRAILAIKGVGNLRTLKLSKPQQKSCVDALKKCVVEAEAEIALTAPRKAEATFNLPD